MNKTCPHCNKARDIETEFGYRFKHTKEVVQAWCIYCRNGKNATPLRVKKGKAPLSKFKGGTSAGGRIKGSVRSANVKVKTLPVTTGELPFVTSADDREALKAKYKELFPKDSARRSAKEMKERIEKKQAAASSDWY